MRESQTIYTYTCDVCLGQEVNPPARSGWHVVADPQAKRLQDTCSARCFEALVRRSGYEV